MSLLDSISQWIDKDRTQLAVRIPAHQVDKPPPPLTLQAGMHYIRLRLASMYLNKAHWFKDWYPMVYSSVRFQFGDQLIEIPNIVDESRLTMPQTPGGDIFVQDFVLTPLIPFQRGVVSLAAGLFAVAARNYPKSVLKTFGEFASLLNVPELSPCLDFAEPLATGIQELVTPDNARIHLGLHYSFSPGELQDGYFAAIRSAADIKPMELFVVNDELYERGNPRKKQPFLKADYMLFHAELLDNRDEWELKGKIIWGRSAIPEIAPEIRPIPEVAPQPTIAPELAPRPIPEIAPEIAPRPEVAPPSTAGRGVRRGARSNEEEEEKPSFYFATSGEGVRGNQVRLGAEFDLTFNYGIERASRMAILEGEKLKELLLTDIAELDIVIIPRGFKLKQSRWRQRATFVKGALLKKVVFHLQAAKEAIADARIDVIFETKGAVLYEFSLPFQLTPVLDSAVETPFDPLNFNLDDLASEMDRQQRTALLDIWADSDGLSINFNNFETGESFPASTRGLTRTSLADFLGKTKDDLDPVPNNLIWGLLADPLGKPNNEGAEKEFNDCLERVATAGWELYKKLNADSGFAKVLDAVERLEPGSTLSIKTDCAFLPWEILNPSPFNWGDPDKIKTEERPVQPQNFWGQRFIIECLLAGEKRSYKTPVTVHKKSPAYVSMNVFRTIDQGLEGNTFLPGKSHETLAAELQPEITVELRREGSEIRKIFVEENYRPTMIYLLCHGQNDKPLIGQDEKLEIDVNNFVLPRDVYVGYAYPSGPIIFLNSCSSGAASPLAFSTFLSQFREKNALGLIGTSFPVPTTFGSAFGQELIRQYMKMHKPIGQALLDLRRQQLANGNPIGLFYTLQCPLDITSHHK